MLVLKRHRGESIMIGDTRLVTVLDVSPHQHAVTVLIVTTSTDACSLGTQTVQLAENASADLGDEMRLSVVDVVDDWARVGIHAPTSVSVHKLEVYEAIRRENRAAAQKRPPDPDDDGTAGSRVPRPSSPAPPSLDIRLEEPRSD